MLMCFNEKGGKKSHEPDFYKHLVCQNIAGQQAKTNLKLKNYLL